MRRKSLLCFLIAAAILVVPVLVSACGGGAPASPTPKATQPTVAPSPKPAPAPSPAPSPKPSPAPTPKPTPKPTVAPKPSAAPTGTTAAIPAIPHTLEGRADCLLCHKTGVGGAKVVPADHAGRDNTTCQLCHKPK